MWTVRESVDDCQSHVVSRYLGGGEFENFLSGRETTCKVDTYLDYTESLRSDQRRSNMDHRIGAPPAFGGSWTTLNPPLTPWMCVHARSQAIN